MTARNKRKSLIEAETRGVDDELSRQRDLLHGCEEEVAALQVHASPEPDSSLLRQLQAQLEAEREARRQLERQLQESLAGGAEQTLERVQEPQVTQAAAKKKSRGSTGDDEWKKRCEELEAENAELRRIIDELRAQLAALRDKFPHLKAELDKVLGKLGGSTRKVFERLYQDAKDRWQRVRCLRENFGKLQGVQILRVLECLGRSARKVSLRQLHQEISDSLHAHLPDEVVAAQQRELASAWPVQEYPVHQCTCCALRTAVQSQGLSQASASPSPSPAGTKQEWRP